MVTEQTLMQFGLIKDENNLNLKAVLKDKSILKEIHIDIYPENPLITSSTPFMLLLRAIEKKMIISNDDNRLILKKKVDNFETHFVNVLFDQITECYYKTITDGYFEFIFNIQNIYYRITVLN